MKNNFTVEVCFNDVPLYPYEWDNIAFISGIKVMRVKTSTLTDILEFKAKIEVSNQVIILSDCKTCVVLRLDKNGFVKKRSFIPFLQDVDICEFAMSLKCSELKYTISGERLKYAKSLNEEDNMKEYVVESLKKIKDENKYKYLYYLFFNKIDD